jgi:drug/metabolite transporter (DMT)-like permease
MAVPLTLFPVAQRWIDSSLAGMLNGAVPLQQRYGALPVLLPAALIALAVTVPAGVAGISGSELDGRPLAAMLPLGLLGTGWAYVAFALLLGRAGASRGAVAIYFTPVVAIILGVVVRGEHVAAVSVVGAALVIAGAWRTSRREGGPAPAPAEAVPAEA